MLLLQILVFIFVIPLSENDSVPFLEMRNFQFELIYTLKNKPQPENKNYYTGNVGSLKTESLPHVRIKILLDSIPTSYTRYKIFTRTGSDNQIGGKKIKDIEEIDLDIGFTVDIKERIVAHTYAIFFYDIEKNIVSKIVIYFSEEGDFFINDQLMGKI